MYDDVDIDGSNRSIQMTLNPDNSHVELSENDEPIAKRSRVDINYSLGPATAFSPFNGNGINTEQLIQKHSFQNQVQMLQQQQNRRKIAISNRVG